jgi:choline dehydrogenase-like flavoprotein
MQFDYVIVGGGSAGSVLAARLSEDPKVSVCLLEAGGGGNGIFVRLPMAVAAMVPGKPIKINNWSFETVEQPGLNGRKGYQPRGKCLGGSSAINAMLYVRGQREDYDAWADLGCEGWDWDSVLPYFRKAESNERGEDDLHGSNGPLQVCDQKSIHALSEAFVDAATQLQHRRTRDFNTGDNEGVGFYQVTQFFDKDKNGERCSAAAGYVFPNADRPNLTIVTRARARRVTFEGKRATGVIYQHKGQDITVYAKHEVLLCGGAFQSPQLLQLSGIGNGADLSKLGIQVRHDLPGVGQNLQDHLDFILGYKTNRHDTLGISLRGGIHIAREILRWRKDGVSLAASPVAEAGAFLKTDPALDRPDIQLHFLPALLDDHGRKQHLGHGYSCHVCQVRPYSRGSVFLQSTNELAAPGIDPAFLSDPRDIKVMLKGAKMMRDILETETITQHRKKEMFGSDKLKTDEDWENHIRSRADSIYHPVGTCKMGVDEMSVVDPELRVHGIQGLRVVDASVMPNLVSGNTNAPTIMIAERASDLIKAARVA